MTSDLAPDPPDPFPSNLLDDIDLMADLALHEHRVLAQIPDFTHLRPHFGWQPVEVIKQTFRATTRFARADTQSSIRRHYRSRFPACNVHRRSEPVATDTIYSDTPAIGSGHTCAQIFVGKDSLVTDAYGMSTDCLLYTSPSPRDQRGSRMPSSA